MRIPSRYSTTVMFWALQCAGYGPFARAERCVGSRPPAHERFPPFVGVGQRAVLEEQVLRRELEGYADYARRVRYRLLPFVW